MESNNFRSFSQSFKGDNKRVWFSKPKPVFEILKQQEEGLFKSISFEDPPSVAGLSMSRDQFLILSKLIHGQKVTVRFPETLVFGYGFNTPVFFYTDAEGLLKMKTGLKFSHFETIYKIFEYHRQASKKPFPTPLAIVKSTITGSARIIMKASEFLFEINNGMKTGAILQRFIVPKGNKAFKIRVFYSENNFSYFSLCSKTRFDRKQDPKPLQDKKSLKVRKIATILENPSESVLNKRHQQVSHEVNSILEEMDEFEVLDRGKMYLEEKNFALNMIEMDTTAFNEKIIHLPRKKKVETRHSNPIMRRQRVNTNQLNELDRYFEEIWQSCMFIEDSLQTLFKELESSTPSKFFNSLAEENVFSNFLIYKLKTIFLIDTSDQERFTTTSISQPFDSDSIEKSVLSLKKALNCRFFARSNEFIDSAVVDFCEDFSGNFFFIDVKSFTKKKFAAVPVPVSEAKNIFRCPGRFCRFKETMDDSLDTLNISESHSGPKVFKILSTSLKEAENDLQNLIKCNFDKTVDVCEDCFKKYMKKSQEGLKKLQKNSSVVDVKKFRFSQSIGNFKLKSLKPSEEKKMKRPASFSKFFRRKKEIAEVSRFIERNP
jgi:hypothetical protein